MDQPKYSKIGDGLNHSIALKQKMHKFSNVKYFKSRGILFLYCLANCEHSITTYLLNECMLLIRYVGGARDDGITRDFYCLHYPFMYFQISHHIFNNGNFNFKSYKALCMYHPIEKRLEGYSQKRGSYLCVILVFYE